MKDRFMKNGVFSLEYDKETLRDIVLELQEENKKQKEVIDKAMIELDTIINDLEKHGDEAPAPSKEELCKIFNILKEVSE
ncbi:MAG: hypothetical protein MR405_07740 [Mollicutes bacterium]|nr:hypothetical protein [Mollicutes bacterium]